MTTRRELLIGAASLALVPACGTSTTGSPDAASGPMCSSNIVANHGHVLTVPGADLAATSSHDYNIQGTADHTHTVTLAQTDLQMLAAGTAVTVTSSLGGGHTHVCMVHCTG